MLLKKNKTYEIIQLFPHLIIATERPNVIAMPDTGFNGKISNIPFKQTDLPQKYKRHTIKWLGSKYFTRIANVFHVNCVTRQFSLRNENNKSLSKQVKMNKSGKMCMWKFLCLNGDIVTIDATVNGIKANAFVDTGAIDSMLLRDRIKKFKFNAKECVIPGKSIVVENQSIRYYMDNNLHTCVLNSCFKTGVVCGSRDKYPSQSTNKVLAKLPISPQIDVVIGNDFLSKLNSYEFDYKRRTFAFRP